MIERSCNHCADSVYLAEGGESLEGYETPLDHLERTGHAYNEHSFDNVDAIVRLRNKAPDLLRDLKDLCDEVERLREQRTRLAETLRVVVSESELADWVQEALDE